MRLPARNISDTEYKLRVLSCVDALQMATRDQLWPFVARLDLMEYMPMCVYVDELRGLGALQAGEHALENVLYLTDAGREYLRLFGSRMPQGDRERIRREAPAYLRQLDKRRQLGAAYERAPQGEYRVLCTYREGDVPTLVLRVTTRDNALAQRVANGFERAASAVLTALYTLPTRETTPACKRYADLDEAMAAAKPGAPALCAYGKREHGAVVCLAGARAAYVAALLSPTAEAAERWADAADAQGAPLADRLTALFDAPIGEADRNE